MNWFRSYIVNSEKCSSWCSDLYYNFKGKNYQFGCPTNKYIANIR